MLQLHSRFPADQPRSGYLDRISGLPPVVAGRVLARYASAGDAAISARRIKQGDLHLAAVAAPEVVSAFKQMKVSQAGTTVEIGFDLDMFEGFDLEQLKRWLQQVMEADGAPR